MKKSLAFCITLFFSLPFFLTAQPVAIDTFQQSTENYVSFNNNLYFSKGSELWKSDGTNAGMELVVIFTDSTTEINATDNLMFLCKKQR